MRLSILDQAPILRGQTARQALDTAIDLAVKGEEYGFHRYWIAEHHDLPGLACPAPEVILGAVGARTSKIRIGTGAVLLPYYRPFKIAETYHTLATLFSGRIDIGIGRAPGGSAEASNALSGNYLEQVWKFPRLAEELLEYIEGRADSGNQHASLTAAPYPEIPPAVWMLGTGKKSALLAAELGLPYAYGQFMGSSEGLEWVKEYRRNFIPRKKGDKPEVILAVSAFCADTEEEARRMIDESFVYLAGTEDNTIKSRTFFGSPDKVAPMLQGLKTQWNADEIMICSHFGTAAERLRSYKLIKAAAECL